MHGHDEWLRISREDLLAAKTLLKVELFSSVEYHCQQSAEKALKAYLVFKKQKIVKTHDLLWLVKQCVKLDRSFEKMFDAAEQLNPFSSKFRYPTEFEIPDLDDAKSAIRQTQEILRFVLKKIAGPEAGQIDIFEE